LDECARWVAEAGASNDQSGRVGALGAGGPRPPLDHSLVAKGVWPTPLPPPTGRLDGGLAFPFPLTEGAIGLLAPGLPAARCTSRTFGEYVPYCAIACGGVYAAHRSAVGGPGGATLRGGEGRGRCEEKTIERGVHTYILVDGFRALSGVVPWP
jgi:hypothetical protein